MLHYQLKDHSPQSYTALCPGSRKHWVQQVDCFIAEPGQWLEHRIWVSMKLRKIHQKDPSILSCGAAADRNSRGPSRAPVLPGTCPEPFPFLPLYFVCWVSASACVSCLRRLLELLESESLAKALSPAVKWPEYGIFGISLARCWSFAAALALLNWVEVGLLPTIRTALKCSQVEENQSWLLILVPLW